jgi:hypothetical protein
MSTNAVRYGLIAVCIVSALSGAVAYEYVALGFDQRVTGAALERRMARDFFLCAGSRTLRNRFRICGLEKRRRCCLLVLSRRL